MEEEYLTEGTVTSLEEMLFPRVDIGAIADVSDIEKINVVAFELYKEAISVVNLAAHLLGEVASLRGGWQRDQAICAGLLIRITKFMRVVLQLSAQGNRGEVLMALNRSIMESAINLEFLATTNDDKFFDQFVKFSLGPEKELYDIIQANVAARDGDVWPIEQRMLNSINEVCQASGVKVEDLNQKYGDWGGGLKERLKRLNKEHQYIAMQRMPSHAVHGTWVDLYKHHLEHNQKSDAYSPAAEFSSADERHLGPTAILVLEPTKVYLQRFFPRDSSPESNLLFDRIDDLLGRISQTGSRHEEIMSNK